MGERKLSEMLTEVQLAILQKTVHLENLEQHAVDIQREIAATQKDISILNERLHSLQRAIRVEIKNGSLDL